jgi:Predicted amidohydrolase
MSQLHLSLIQTQLHWEDKAANLHMLQQKIDSIGFTEVVVLPEMFSTGFSMRPQQLAETMQGPTVQWMQATAARKKNHSYRQPHD